MANAPVQAQDIEQTDQAVDREVQHPENTPTEVSDVEPEQASAPSPPEETAPEVETLAPSDPVESKTGLNQGVADILRAEAARETAERSSEGRGTKPETDASHKQAAIDDAMDDRNNVSQVDVDMSDAAAVARSELLPDIEEINSTLTAGGMDSSRQSELSEEYTNRKSGFRRGFIFAVVVFAILALVYVFARQIADAVPQTAAILSSYVDWVNQLRETVDGLMLRAVDKLTGLLAQLSTQTES